MSSIDYIKGIIDISIPEVDEDKRVALAENIAQAVYGKCTEVVLMYFAYHPCDGDTMPSGIANTTVLMPVNMKGNPFELRSDTIYQGWGTIMMAGELTPMERKYGRR